MLDLGINSDLGDEVVTSLYIKNGRNSLGKALEVLIVDGKISQVAPELTDIQANQTIDLEGKSYVSAGWIDDHVHCYEKLSLYYDEPDQVGYKTGVTTVIDAGSTGADNIGDFYQLTRNKKTNVYAMINISKTGILAQNELADLDKLQFEPLQQAVTDYSDFIVGLKARISKSVVVDKGLKPLMIAKDFQQRLMAKLPLMVHVGTNPPELSEILAVMEAGDILTHCYNGKANGILNSDDKVKEFVYQARDRGIIFDIGHGSDSFNFHTATTAVQNQVLPQSLSTDIYHKNRELGPVYNMATCIEKMLWLGFDLAEVIPMITTVPAQSFDLKNKGRLQPGFDGDLTIFNMETGTKELTDSDGFNKQTHTLVKPLYSVINGVAYEIGE